MNQETAKDFVFYFALKYFSYIFPQEVLDLLAAYKKSTTDNQLLEPNFLLDWDKKISVQSHWRGVIEDYESDRENAITRVFKQGMFNKKKLKIKSEERQGVFIFNPFGFVVRNDKYFIVGSFDDNQQSYLLTTSKITQISLMDEQAIQADADFDLDYFSETYLNHPTTPEIIESLRVEFPEKAYFYVKSHPIKCEELVLSEPQGAPGYFTLTAKNVKNTFLLHQWLNSFHDDAQVLAPSFIRHHINRSFIDQLTNLYNRKAFDRLGSREIEHYYRNSACFFSILVIDIDHFKNINDQHGHVFGDEVLIKVAECFRDYDAIRYGGEEFVILLPNTHASEANRAAERIRKSIELLSIKSAEGVHVPVTISIGIAEFPIHLSGKDRAILENKDKYKLDHRTKGSLMIAITEQADKALYKAKQTGRNKSLIIEDVD